MVLLKNDILTIKQGDIKMKDIKSYVIGFLTCACLFLIMGQTKSSGQGRYQISTTTYNKSTIYATIMDTQTGCIYKKKILAKTNYKY